VLAIRHGDRLALAMDARAFVRRAAAIGSSADLADAAAPRATAVMRALATGG
jgi:hypothetical protein